MDDWYENGSHSIVLALSRKPRPYPWTPASAGATVESGRLFISLRGLHKTIVILSAAEIPRSCIYAQLQAATPNPT